MSETEQISSPGREGEPADVEAVRRATAQLLWAAAAPFPDADAIASACAGEFDAALLAGATIRQWVAPLVWRGLTMASCAEALPREAAAGIHSEAVRWTAKAFFLESALERAIAPLAAVGLEPVVFKGAALAERYPDPALRPMGDIDLLLPSRSHSASIAALEQAGWITAQPVDRTHHETTLIHPDVPTLALELHVALDRWYERVARVDSDRLLERRQPATLFGTPAYVLNLEDELVVLASHAGKPFHCFDRLMWFADLAVVIASADGGVDWELVQRRAEEARASTILAVALNQTARLGADVPSQVLRNLPGPGWRSKVLAPLLELEWPLSPSDGTTRRRARYALAETWLRRIVLMLGESPHDPFWRQPVLVGRRARMAAFGLQRLRRNGPR